MKKETVGTVVSIIVGFVAFVFAIVGVSTNAWLTFNNGKSGLWNVCGWSNDCGVLKIGSSETYRGYEMVRGFGVIAVAMGFAGILFGLLSLFLRNKFNIGPSVLASMFMMSALFSLICAAVFSGLTHNSSTKYGYSFGLTWASFPLLLISGVTMTYIALTTEDD